MTLRIITSLTALCCWSAAAAILPTDRYGQWQGNVGVLGGIPTVTTIYTNFYSTNTAAEITSGVQACPSNQVVYLNAGTYNLSNRLEIYKNGVVLRGAGVSNTILRFFANDYGMIYVNGKNVIKATEGFVDAKVSWTNNFTQGSTNLIVNTLSNIVAGDIIYADQINDNVDVNAFGYEGESTGSRDGGTRSQLQCFEVQSVSGNTITVWPPVAMPNWSLAKTPELWKPSSGWNDWVKRMGFEDFGMDGTYSEGFDPYGANLWLFGAVDCWVTNVHSYNPQISHINTYTSFRCEVRHCYFYGTQSAGTLSYGILSTGGDSCLFEDNIFEKCVAGMMDSQGGQNNVWAFNYITNIYYTASDHIQLAGISANHSVHTSMVLWEGNHGNAIESDFVHGSGSHHTFFRNRMTGAAEWVYPGGPIEQGLRAFQLGLTNYYMSAVGNVFGTTGIHTNYEWDATADLDKYSCVPVDAVVYLLGVANRGYTNTYAGGYFTNSDAKVKNTFYRHGDWDSANGAQTWNATNADHTLPNSLFRTSKPAYFGNLAWPPFNPASVTAASTSPTNIPAGYRFVYGLDPPTTRRTIKATTLRVGNINP